MQVLGRNLEALITAAEAVKSKWGDDFVSVEHMVLAFEDDARFGRQLLRNEGLDSAKLDEAIKAIRGGNRVTDQARALPTFTQGPFAWMCARSRCLLQAAQLAVRLAWCLVWGLTVDMLDKVLFQVSRHA